MWEYSRILLIRGHIPASHTVNDYWSENWRAFLVMYYVCVETRLGVILDHVRIKHHQELARHDVAASIRLLFSILPGGALIREDMW